MTWIIENWKLVIGGILSIVLFGTGWHMGSSSVQDSWDKEKLANATLQAQLAEKNAKTIGDLENEKQSNLVIIDTLRSSITGLYLPTCSGQVHPSTGINPAASTSGLLPDGEQAAIDKYTTGTRQLLYEADKVVEQCRVMQEWIKTLPQ